jgi:hypothetical protein
MDKKVTYGRKEQNLLGKHNSRSQILKQIACDPLDHLMVEMPLDADVLGESLSANDGVAPSNRYILVYWGKGSEGTSAAAIDAA